MTDTVYKAVFECPGLGERFVWWVSSRHEVRKHVSALVKGASGNVAKRYKDNEWTVTVKKLFEDKYDVFYNDASMYSGT